MKSFPSVLEDDVDTYPQSLTSLSPRCIYGRDRHTGPKLVSGSTRPSRIYLIFSKTPDRANHSTIAKIVKLLEDLFLLFRLGENQ